jgi:hypothetical protein
MRRPGNDQGTSASGVGLAAMSPMFLVAYLYAAQ